jgi:endoglucanase
MNWSGFETPTFSPHGLGVRSLGSILDQIRSLGYNAIRLPFATEIFDPAKTPLGIDYTKNPELSGLSGLALFDAVIAGARERGLKVILDRHRLDSSGQTELWYSAQIPESRVIAEWQTLAQRYKDDSTVIGVDLFNEPHGAARWGNGDPATDWRMAAERLGNAVLAVNPHLLILVEGVETANDRWYWWGGNLRAAGASPVSLSVPNQLVYSAHDYPVAVSTQPWFFDLSYPHNMPPIWDETWGYLHENGIAPVLVGEWGSRYESWMDQTWMNELAQYLKDNGISFTYWCLNPDSANTGGLLADDWTTVHAAKQAVLAPLLAPPLP